MNTVEIGDIGELKAQLLFAQQGAIVSRPLTTNSRYDLIVDIQGHLYKVQVKTTAKINDGKMIFATKTTNYVKGNWKSVPYTLEEVDIFFLYCIENDWCGLYIPNKENPMSQIIIRVVPPRNNQKTGIHFAEDFSFLKQYGTLVQLVE